MMHSVERRISAPIGRSDTAAFVHTHTYGRYIQMENVAKKKH